MIHWQTYLWPKLYTNREIEADKRNKRKMLIAVGRRFGKTSLAHRNFISSLPISDEEKKKLLEIYEKALRGEE